MNQAHLNKKIHVAGASAEERVNLNPRLSKNASDQVAIGFGLAFDFDFGCEGDFRHSIENRCNSKEEY